MKKIKNHLKYYLIACLLSLVSTAFAGVGITRVTNPQPIGVSGECITSSLDSLLRAAFPGEKPKEKIKSIRNNINIALKGVRRVNDTIANCLEELLKRGRLCIDNTLNDKGKRTHYGIAFSSSAVCDSTDAISIHLSVLQACDEGFITTDTSDFGLYILFITLLHEGKHLIQPALSLNPSCTDTLIRVKIRKHIAASEVETYCLEISVLDTLIKGLNEFIQAPLGFTTSSPIIRFFINKIYPSPQDPTSTGIERAKKRTQILLESLKKEKEKVERLKKNYNDIATKCNDFLNKKITFKTLKRILKREKYWVLVGNKPFFYRNEIYVSGIEQDTIFHLIGNQERFLLPPLDKITDILINPTGNKMLVAGITPTLRSVIYGYEDFNGDGFFDADSEKELFNFFGFEEGIDFCQLQDGRLLILDYSSKILFQLDDYDEDFFPDFFNPEPLCEPLQFILLADIVATNSSNILYAFPFHFENRVLIPNSSFLQIIDRDNDSFFEDQIEDEIFKYLQFTPILVSDLSNLLECNHTATIHGSYKAKIKIHEVDSLGNSFGIIGEGVTDMNGNVNIEYLTSLSAGMLIQIRDASNNLNSVINPVGKVDIAHDYELKFPKDTTIIDISLISDTSSFIENGCNPLEVNINIEPIEINGETWIKRIYNVIDVNLYDGESEPTTIMRDLDCDGIEGNQDIYLLKKSDVCIFFDGDNVVTNNFPAKNSRTCAQGNPKGYWEKNGQLGEKISNAGYWQYEQLIKIKTTSTRPISFSNRLTLFPNPTSNIWQLAAHLEQPQKFIITVFDISGKYIKSVNWQYRGSDTLFEYDMQNLPSGVYQIKIQGDNGFLVWKKVILQN